MAKIIFQRRLSIGTRSLESVVYTSHIPPHCYVRYSRFKQNGDPAIQETKRYGDSRVGALTSAIKFFERYLPRFEKEIRAYASMLESKPISSVDPQSHLNLRNSHMMSRQNYITLARGFRYARPDKPPFENVEDYKLKYMEWEHCVRMVTNQLRKDDSHLNVVQFMQECGQQ